MHCTASLAALAALTLIPLSSAAGFYGKNSGVLEIMGKDFDRLIRNSANSSIVEFYAPWCGHCQNLKPAYEKAGKSLEGLVNVAAVNCDEEDNKPFCGSMRVQGFPTIKTVKVTGTIGKPIITDYTGPRTAADIVEAGKKLVPNYVERLERKDFDGWLEKKNDTAKAILFSDKGVTSALIKSLANDYRGNMAIAQVRDKEKEINTMFGITNYPTLVVLPGGDKSAVIYDGELKKPAMSRFLSQYAELRTESDKRSKKEKSKAKESKTDKKSASSDSSKFAEASASQASAQGASSAAASAKTISLEEPAASESPDPIPDKEAPSPAPLPDIAPPIPALETLEDLQSNCLGPDTHTCLLALLPPKASSEAELPPETTAALANLAELAQKHKNRGDHLFPFYSVPASNIGGETLPSTLDLEKPQDMLLLAVNGKRKWYRVYDHAAKGGFSGASVEDWVDGIRLGEGKKHKLPEDLFASASSATDSAKESKTTSAEGEGTSEATASSAKETVSIVHEEL